MSRRGSCTAIQRRIRSEPLQANAARRGYISMKSNVNPHPMGRSPRRCLPRVGCRLNSRRLPLRPTGRPTTVRSAKVRCLRPEWPEVLVRTVRRVRLPLFGAYPRSRAWQLGVLRACPILGRGNCEEARGNMGGRQRQGGCQRPTVASSGRRLPPRPAGRPTTVRHEIRPTYS